MSYLTLKITPKVEKTLDMKGNFVNPRPLRYNITIRIAAFDRGIRRNIKKDVLEKMGISESTLSRWLHTRKDDRTDMPGLALRYFANYLNATMEELFNDRDDEINEDSQEGPSDVNHDNVPV